MAALAPLLAVAFLAAIAQAADPFAFFDWDVSYITSSPLGVPQQVRAPYFAFFLCCLFAATTSTQLCVSFLIPLRATAIRNRIQSGVRLLHPLDAAPRLGFCFLLRAQEHHRRDWISRPPDFMSGGRQHF